MRWEWWYCVCLCVFYPVCSLHTTERAAVMSCCEGQGLSSSPLGPPLLTPLCRFVVKTSLDLASNQPHTETNDTQPSSYCHH